MTFLRVFEQGPIEAARSLNWYQGVAWFVLIPGLAGASEAGLWGAVGGAGLGFGFLLFIVLLQMRSPI